MHVFDRTADETISWIQEKGALLAAEDYGHDLDTIQTLIQKHQGFEADLAAVKEQVRYYRLTKFWMYLINLSFSGGMCCTRSWSVIGNVPRR